jgi:1-deoxy-D-xylulose-5-phosphate synthase
VGVKLDKDIDTLPIGKGEILSEGKNLLILAVGNGVAESLQAVQQLNQDGIGVTLVNCRFVKPLDIDLINQLAGNIKNIITVEENVLHGGFGSAVLESLNNNGISSVRVRRIGISDTFVEHGPQKLLRSKYHVDAKAIVDAAKQLLK